MGLELLPSDLISVLFLLLEGEDLGRIGRVSKKMRSISSNEKIWEILFKRRYGRPTETIEVPIKNSSTTQIIHKFISWKEEFKRHCIIEKNFRKGFVIKLTL